jgi:two-component sensor histidine kinase
MKTSVVVLGSLLWGWLSQVSYAQTNLLPDSLATAPDTVKTWTLRQMGDSLIRVGKLSHAKQAFEEAFLLSKRINIPTDLGTSYRGLAYWYSEVGDHRQAITYYQKAMAQYEKTNSRERIVRTLQMMSHNYAQLNDLKTSRYYLQKAMTLAEQTGDPDLVMQLTDALATLAGKSKNHRLALALQQKTTDYYKRQNNWDMYFGCLFNLAITYKNLGHYPQSEAMFREVLNYADRSHDEYMKGYVCINLPNTLIARGKLDEAEALCRQALEWAEKTGTEKHSVQEEVYGTLTQIYEKRGNYQQALAYTKRQAASHDSVFNATKNRQLAEIETRYQIQEKEARIQALNESNRQKTQLVWASASGLIVVTLLLGTLFWLYQKIRRSRAQIQHQSEQLTLAMRELHHRIKNNLAIVSSLLKLQSNRLEDEKAVQAVRVGQQRVEAMSLIHQRLYQTDRVATVNMREYLADLASSLMLAYGYQADAFDLHIDMDEEELDVDVAMPLGLIVNELVTNAFKYAYANVQRPSLRIGLRNGNGITLEVQDNGPGIETADWQQTGHRSSFGKRLIVSLSEQLDGRFELIKHNGTLFRLHIPEARLRLAA